jgi:SAM-dependent methyltransferase
MLSSILELGCGTGKHAEVFSNSGFTVHGIDSSSQMLKIAKLKTIGKQDKLSFSHSKIQDLDLDKKFDVVTSLFHVMSYQTSNKNLIKAFKVAKNHLNKGGVFIFDFWYGPAVLTDLPVTRVKRLKNEEIKVTRIAEPELKPDLNIVDVNYDIFIQDIKSKEIIQQDERHEMRYFFDSELEVFISNIGFKVKKKYKWLNFESPDFNSWNVVWILEK